MFFDCFFDYFSTVFFDRFFGLFFERSLTVFRSFFLTVFRSFPEKFSAPFHLVLPIRFSGVFISRSAHVIEEKESSGTLVIGNSGADESRLSKRLAIGSENRKRSAACLHFASSCILYLPVFYLYFTL